jgi:hypothetical protein
MGQEGRKEERKEGGKEERRKKIEGGKDGRNDGQKERREEGMKEPQAFPQKGFVTGVANDHSQFQIVAQVHLPPHRTGAVKR